MNWDWVKRCVNKKYHNDKYVQLRVPVLKNSCSIDGAYAHPVPKSRSCLKYTALLCSRRMPSVIVCRFWSTSPHPGFCISPEKVAS